MTPSDGRARIALGTAQFGMAYGIANQSGQVTLQSVREILSTAQKNGVVTLDTATAYGESQNVLGEAGVDSWRIVSKLPALPEQALDPSAWVRDHLRSTLASLRVDKLDALLLHRPADLLRRDGSALSQALVQLRQEGLVGKLGLSLYRPEELDVVSDLLPLDLVQVPMSVLDHRFDQAGKLDELAAQGTEIHARSIFLQGLLLVPADRRPAKFDRWAGLWERWDEWLTALQISSLQGALGAVLADERVDRVVVGVDSLEQMGQILDAAALATPCTPLDLMSADEELLLPQNWVHL